jgi:phosphoglycolate phosphatase-like HAD superfamily hydrolase
MFKAVIYDLDGTLLDSLPMHLEAYREALSRQEKRVPDDEIIKNCFNVIHPVVAKHYGLDLQIFTKDYEDCARLGMARVGFFPGAQMTAEQLADAGIELGICTMMSEDVFRQVAKMHDLGIFKTSITNGRERLFKTELLRRACKALQHAPNEMCFVGDSPGDMKAAHELGMPGILFHPEGYDRYYDLADIIKYKPRHVVKSHAEICRIVLE